MEKATIISQLNEWRGKRVHRKAENCEGKPDWIYNSVIVVNASEEGMLIRWPRFHEEPFMLQADKWLDDKWELASENPQAVDYV